MPQLQRAKSPPSEGLTSVEHLADTWEVDPKTIGKWVDIIYLAFDISLPKSGPYPMWGVQLIDLCGKHISKRATLYFAETQEARRLKANEFIRKIRHLRQEGHFEELQRFRQFQNSQDVQHNEEEDEIDTLSELAAIAQTQDEQLFNAQQMFEAREDEQIEKLATFIEGTDQRRMSKLARRLQQRQIQGTSTDQAIDVSFRRLPG